MTKHTHSLKAPDYLPGTIEALLQSDVVTAPTRRVLEERLHPDVAQSPRFFDDSAYAALRATCDRLIPQPDRQVPIEIAAAVDDRLARNVGKGWRYASLPPDRDAYVLALRGIDECATALYRSRFVDLAAAQQDEVLTAVQNGSASGEAWKFVPPALFFEELLAELVETYYSHPLAQEEIGYVGFADAHGWQEIGLDELASHEPRPLR